MEGAAEMAGETMEHAHHGHTPHLPLPHARASAILVAVFAAIGVVIETGSNDAQTTYLAQTIAASDLWNEYQAKSVRRTIWSEAADALAASATTTVPTASPSGVEAAIDRARSEAARMGDDPAGGGMKQLAGRVQADEHVRDHAHHLHEQLERSVRVLQIAIVLTGLYLATQVEALVLVGLVLGFGAIVRLARKRVIPSTILADAVVRPGSMQTDAIRDATRAQNVIPRFPVGDTAGLALP